MVFGSKEKKEQERLQREREQSEAAAASALRKEKAEAERAQLISEFVETFVERVEETVNSGTPVSLFRDVYIPVDAQMNAFGPPAGLDLVTINDLGSNGWRILGVVPRTYGGFRSYKISKTTAYGVSGWGKDEHQVGLGGHIVGVYALVEFTVSLANLATSRSVIESVAQESLPENLRAASVEV
jgi:hypothetical protein